MRAIVLVGGEGTRLRPLTLTTPKQLLPVAEVPLVERVLGHLGAHGVNRAVLSLGYRPDAFFSAYPGGRAAGVELTWAVEPEPMDTAGAIAFAAVSAGVDETVLAVNGDVLTDLDVGALVGFHRDHGAEATIHLTPVDDPSAFGVVPTDAAGRVEAFVEKPARHEAPTNLINAGTYVLEPTVLDRIAAGRRVSMERETFPALVEAGSLYAMATSDYWLDTGTPEQYLQAHRDLLSGRRLGPPAAGATELGPGAWMLGRATAEGTVGEGSLLGDGSVVASGAEVRASVVGAGARVETGARVKEAVLMAGAVVGAGASVSDSILGPRSVVGDGARLWGMTVLGEGAEVAPGDALEQARVSPSERLLR